MLKLSRNEKLAHATIYLLLILLTLAFPDSLHHRLFYVVHQRCRVRSPRRLRALPRSLLKGAYDILFGRSKVILNAYGVTLFRVVVGTGFNLAFTITMAYALAKRDLPGRVPLTIFVFITMVFSGGLIPRFLLVDALGLRNTLWSMVFPGLINAWNMLIMRNFLHEPAGRAIRRRHRRRRLAADGLAAHRAAAIHAGHRHHRAFLRRLALEFLV